MGNNNSSIAFPDNDERRERVDQLDKDVRMLAVEFETLETQYLTLDNEVRGEVVKYLQQNGFSDLAALDSGMLAFLSEEDKADWESIKQSYPHDTGLGMAVQSVSGIGFLKTKEIQEIRSLSKAPKPPKALSDKLEKRRNVLAILGIGIGLLVNAAKMRKQLRDAITRLVKARLEAKEIVMDLEVLVGFMGILKIFFSDPDLQPGFHSALGETLATEVGKASREKAIQDLKRLDTQRKSWTNEDPKL